MKPIYYVLIVVVLVIAWFLASPLFLDKTVDEEMVEGDMTLTGSFVDADSFHKTAGTAKILETGDSRTLRFENFEATNGPDLFVYLATNENADDFVNLGRLKGNMGNQNYEIPADVDLDSHNKVLIWCRAFGVLFGSAELS